MFTFFLLGAAKLAESQATPASPTTAGPFVPFTYPVSFGELESSDSFVLSTNGVDKTCPTDSSPITDEATCEKAATALGLNFETGGEVDTTIDKPTVCWVCGGPACGPTKKTVLGNAYLKAAWVLCDKRNLKCPCKGYNGHSMQVMCEDVAETDCETCDAGYHLNGMECNANKCKCNDDLGEGAMGPACPVNEASKCVNCSPGKILRGDECVEDSETSILEFILSMFKHWVLWVKYQIATVTKSYTDMFSVKNFLQKFIGTEEKM